MKKLLPIVFVFTLIFPQVTYAEWWNPVTWFSQPDVQQEVPANIPKVEITEPVTEPPIAPKVITKEVPVEKIITKIVEKPVVVEKTITVQDPTLLSQIELLKTQINLLKAELANKTCPTGSISTDTSTTINQTTSSTNKTPLYPIINGSCLDTQPCSVTTCKMAQYWMSYYSVEAKKNAEKTYLELKYDRGIQYTINEKGLSGLNTAQLEIYNDLTKKYNADLDKATANGVIGNELISYYCP